MILSNCFKNLEYVCDNIPSAAVVINTNYNIEIFNKSAESLFGIVRQNIVGQNIRTIMDPAFLSQIPFEETLKQGVKHTGLEETFHYKGRSLQAMFDLVPLLNQGMVIGALITIKDLTSIKEIEHRMQHLEVLAGIGQMAAGTVHEIRNPLTSVNGFVQLLQARAARLEDKTAVSHCKLIIEEIAHINNILSDFLTLAKPSDKKPITIEIVQLLKDVVNLIYGEALLFQISIVKNIPDNPLYIKGNSEKIKEVLINICRNAFQAMMPGGALSIAVRSAAEKVFIEISDTGHGMTEATIANIFKPFFTTKDTGTGLGLAICQRIVHDHHGEIKVKSDLGQGSTFTLIFPQYNELEINLVG